jgi:hypothetical protein
MATGQLVDVPAYRGTLELVDAGTGAFDAVFICIGDEYLLGLPAINHFRVTFDHGQRLILEP